MAVSPAIDRARAAVADAKAQGDRRGEVDALVHLGRAYAGEDLVADAAEAFSAAAAVAGTLGESAVEARALTDLAAALNGIDRLDDALAAVRRTRATGETRRAAAEAESYGGLLLALGRLDDAIAAYNEAADLLDPGSATADRYRVLLQVALAAQRRGRWPEALSALAEAHRLCRSLGDSAREPYLVASTAAALFAVGRYREAGAAAAAAVDGYRRAGDPVGWGRSLATAGQAQDATGDQEAARALWEAALGALEGRDPEGAAAVRALLGNGTITSPEWSGRS